MRGKILALLIPALFVVGAAHTTEVYNRDGNKLDLYGKVGGLYYFSDNSAKDGDQNYIRLSSKSETQVNDQLTGCDQWEYNIQANNTESSTSQSWTRLTFAELKLVDYGSFDYGRSYGIMYDTEDWTDMLPKFDGDSYTNADNFTASRANGVAIYCNTGFFGLVNGLSSAVQYQGNNESASNGREGTSNGRDVHHENGGGWGLSTTYDLSMSFSVGAACISSDRTNDQINHTAAGGDKTDAWIVGLRYDTNNIYLVTIYSETRNIAPFGDSDYAVTNKAQNFEVIIRYQSDFGLCPAVSFLMSKGRDLHAADGANNPIGVDDKDLVKHADVGVTYYFNKNMSTCADYKISLLDEDGSFYAANDASTGDIVALGLVYQF